METRCWAKMSRQPTGGLAYSTPPRLASSAVIPQDTLSAAVLGNRYITLTHPNTSSAR